MDSALHSFRDGAKAAPVSARSAVRAGLTSCVAVWISVKSGKVVVLLNGRFAGRKAIVVKTYDEGRGDRKFGHAIGMLVGRGLPVKNGAVR